MATTVKRKRGRPRKETSLPNTLQPKHMSSILADVQEKEISLSLQSESTEDAADGETCSEVKRKRNRRCKVLDDDYVADFNTSDEEESSEVFHCISGRGRGKGRGLKYEFPRAFEDFLSSYNEFYGKHLISSDEGTNRNIFEDLDQSGVDEQSLSDKNQSQGSQRKKQAHDGIEGVIGANGQTQIQIVNSGETTVIDGKESLIYNIITITGEKRNITPLIIPKVVGDEGDQEKDSPSKTDTGDEDERVTNSLSEESSKSSVSSREMLNKQQTDRALLRQVASLKHKYYLALQELKKRPQVATLAELVYSAANFLTEDQLIFFTLQLKSGCSNIPGIKFSVREKMLALAIYLESPALYKWHSSVFHLPSKLILERWLEGIARNDPEDAKKIVYNTYTRYIFKT